jgi:hypothetical protein
VSRSKSGKLMDRSDISVVEFNPIKINSRISYVLDNWDLNSSTSCILDNDRQIDIRQLFYINHNYKKSFKCHYLSLKYNVTTSSNSSYSIMPDGKSNLSVITKLEEVSNTGEEHYIIRFTIVFGDGFCAVSDANIYYFRKFFETISTVNTVSFNTVCKLK